MLYLVIFVAPSIKVSTVVILTYRLCAVELAVQAEVSVDEHHAVELAGGAVTADVPQRHPEDDAPDADQASNHLTQAGHHARRCSEHYSQLALASLEMESCLCENLNRMNKMSGVIRRGKISCWEEKLS